MISTTLWSTPILAFMGSFGGDMEATELFTSPLDTHQRIEMRANTFTQSSQEDASLAVDSKGRMLVAWASRRQELGTYGVFAQLLDPLGRPIGTELHINETLEGNQSDPSLAFGPNGTGWATWSSTLPNTNKNGVFVRRLVDGENGFDVTGSELIVGEHSSAYFQDPVIAVDGNGDALVVWTRTTGSTSNVIEARQVAADGTMGKVVTLDSEASFVRMPDVAALPGGGFAVTWGSFDDLGRPAGLRGMRLAQDGTQTALALGVSKEGRYDFEASLDVDDAGNILVAWMSADRNTGSTDVYGRRFDAEGKAQGEAFVVQSQAMGYLSGATAIVAPDGRFAVAYNHHSNVEREGQENLKKVEVRAQFFNNDGAAEGETFVIAEDNAGARTMQSGQSARHAVWTGLDQLAVAWSGATVGDGSGVGVSLFAPKGMDFPAPAAVQAMPALAGLTHEQFTDDKIKPDIIPLGLRNLPSTPAPFGNNASTGFRAHTQTQFLPPDPDIAVGPDRIVTQVNGRIRIFDKSGGQLMDLNTNGAAGFWGAQGGEDFIFDPVNTYNTHSDRFFMMNSEIASTDLFVFAASTSSSPSNTNDWHKYRVQVSPTCNFPDFPNLGFNQDAYFVTTDCFNGGGNRAYIFDRTVVESGVAITSIPSVQMSSGLQSLGAIKRYDAGSTGYFISAGFSGGSTLKLQAITNPTTTPSVTSFTVAVSSFSSPPDAVQMGTSNRLATIDNRIKHGVVRDDVLWATHNVAAGGIARVRWYEIDLNGWPTSGSNPAVLNQGDIDLGSGIYNWFGEIAVNANGDAVIAYNRSSANEFPSIEYVTRFAGTSDFVDPCPIQISAVSYSGSRYGDYSGLVIDPSDDNRFWSHHEYSEGNWSTWTGDITIDGGTPQPIADFVGSPLVGDAPLSVNFTDLSSSSAAGITGWAWNFGDGGSSTAQNPTHLYTAPGTYTVILSATDDNGSDSETKVGYVMATVDQNASVTKRNGSGTNPDIFNTVTLPIIGTAWISSLDSGAVGGGALSFVFGYAAPAQAPTVFGELLVDPTSEFFLLSIGAAIGGVATHNNPVPNEMALIGLSVYTQGFVNNPSILTNALDLILGL
ncbi:MAG: PKD repeat protein [Planctomycetota bacterium]|jgi:PKD repeat protein